MAPVTNIWGTTNDVVDRIGSLNNTQAKSNSDGTYTFILSLKDPGIYNWLDPYDMKEGILTLRWSGFPDQAIGGNPSVESKVLTISEATNSVPSALFVTKQDREKQLLERSNSYNWRVSEVDL